MRRSVLGRDLVACALGGVAVGAVAELVAFLGVAAWVDDVASFSAVWVLAAGLIGRFAPDPAAGALRSAGFLLGMVAGYYLVFWLTIGVVTRFLLVWAVAACVAGPLLGLLGNLTGDRGVAGLLAALALAGLVAGEALMLVGWRGSSPWRPAVVVAAVSAIVFIALSRRPRTGFILLPVAAVSGLLVLLGAIELARWAT